MVFDLRLVRYHNLIPHNREVIIDAIRSGYELGTLLPVNIYPAATPVDQRNSITAGQWIQHRDVGMVIVAPSVTKRLIGVAIVVGSKENLRQCRAIGIVAVSQHQGHDSIQGKARLGIVIEVAQGKIGSSRDGLECDVQRLEVVFCVRIRVDDFPILDLLHDTCQHRKGLTAHAIGIGVKILPVVTRKNDAQACCLANISHHPRIVPGQIDNVIIAREGIVGMLQIGLDVECLQQHLQRMQAGD